MRQDKTQFFRRSPALPFVEMRQAFASTACYHTHSHDEFSFGVIDRGSADYKNQRSHNRVALGSTVTINPGDAHACNPDRGQWSYRMLFVDSHWTGQLQQELFNCKGVDYLPFSSHYDHSSVSYALFSQLFSQLLIEKNDLAAESALIEWFQLQFLNAKGYTAQQETPDNYHIHKVRDLILDQLDNNWSLEQFSQETGLSRYHLIRSFKQHYGQSPHAYQLDQRIKRAKLLLQQGSDLADTAQQLGFADQSHFQRNFKKRVAVSPKLYQSFFNTKAA